MSFVLFSSSFGDFDSSGAGPARSFVPFLIAVLIGFVAWPSVACWGTKVSIYCIIVDRDKIVPAYNPAVVAGQPDFDEETGSGKKSAAERMRALDEMKNLLTEAEYQRKRAEILSDI